MALTKVQADGVNLGDNFAFTGTVTGAGEITASTTAPSEGGAVTTNVVQGLAKAWHTLHGTGTIATLDSLNVASIVDSGTGNYGILFVNAFSNKNFSSPSSASYSTSGVKVFAFDRTDSDNRNGSTSRHNVGASNTSGNDADAQWINSAYLGDLA